MCALAVLRKGKRLVALCNAVKAVYIVMHSVLPNDTIAGFQSRDLRICGWWSE